MRTRFATPPQQRLGLFQIARVEPFREPPVNRSQQFARVLHLALRAPEACEAYGGAEFPGFGLLVAGDRQCALETCLCSRYVRLRRPQRVFTVTRQISAWHHRSFAIVEYDGVILRAWAEAFARLDPNEPPGDVPLQRWLCFIDDCGRFLDCGWVERARALGWGPLDLFGCDRERPFARVDHLELLRLLKGGTILEHRDRAIIETQLA
jgi:hypothetical protein